MPSIQPSRGVPVVTPARKTGGAPYAKWRQDVAPTVIAMAAEMGPDEITARAVAHRMGLQDPQIWRALPRGRADILFLVACNLQIRQSEAVSRHEGARKRSPRTRIEEHFARMLAFDFLPDVKAWRRACAAQGWYWTREQYAILWNDDTGALVPIARDLGSAVAAAWAVYEGTFRDACVMGWTLEEATSELKARMKSISLERERGNSGSGTASQLRQRHPAA